MINTILAIIRSGYDAVIALPRFWQNFIKREPYLNFDLTVPNTLGWTTDGSHPDEIYNLNIHVSFLIANNGDKRTWIKDIRLLSNCLGIATITKGTDSELIPITIEGLSPKRFNIHYFFNKKLPKKDFLRNAQITVDLNFEIEDGKGRVKRIAKETYVKIDANTLDSWRQRYKF